MHHDVEFNPIEHIIEKQESSDTVPKGSIFWRLPQPETRYPNQINLEKLGRSVARTFRNYVNELPCLNGKNHEEIAEKFCNDFFLADFDDHIFAYLANLSLIDNADKRISLSVRIPNHPIFNEHLPSQIAVAVIGYCPTATNNPVFIPERVVLTHGHIEATTYESEVQAQFRFLQEAQFPQRNRANLLNPEFTRSLPKYAVKTKERLAGWLDFLRFKNNLIKRKTQGLRYLGWQFDEDNGQVQFLVVTENEIALKKARSAFNRQNLHAFNVDVSTDPYHFNLKQNGDRIEKGSFADLGQLPAKDGIQKITEEQDKQLWQKVQSLASSLIKNGKSDFDISQAIFAKVFVEISEDLANKIAKIENDSGENDSGEEAEQKRQNKINQIFKKLPETGFLSVSLVGDLALVKRHERAVKNLQQNENCYAPYLSGYLFDIENANEPNELVEITDWYNQKLNEKQKSAVQKMISAPDICLIQGPPGTGKTTVIAEACLQFSKRGETVLLASQAHDALDNALSRLQNHPELRAIRLAKSASRITDSGKEFTGESVLAKHYASLKCHLIEEYLSPISQLTQQIENLQQWKQNADFIVHDLLQLREQYGEQRQLLRTAEQDWECLQHEYNKNLSFFNQQVKYIELIGTLLNVFNCKQSYQSLLAISGRLPKSVLPLAQKLSQLDSMKIKLKFSYELLLADTENQISIFAYFWERFSVIKNVFKKMKVDLEALNSQSTGQLQLIDTQTQLRIEQLTREIDDLANRLDEYDDEEVQDLWKQKRRELRALKEKAMQSGGLDANIYQLFEDGDMFVKHDDVVFLKELLRQRFQAIASFIYEVNVLLQKTIAELNLELQSCNIQKPNDTPIQDQAHIIEQIKSKLEAIKVQGQSKLQQSKQCLIDGGFDENGKLVDIVCEQATVLKNLNFQLKQLRSQNQDFLPLFKRFNQILDNPTARANKDWDELEKPFVESCNLVAITCNEDERTLSDNNFDGFDVVIIDEVSKATPLELLLPLMRGKKAILVGDHRQLPPVFNEADGLTFEDEVEQNENQEDQELSNTDLTKENLNKYEKMVTASLFKELFEKAPESLRERLTVQFRMHPEIMKMINYFYEGNLICGNPDKERVHHLQFKGLLSKKDHLLWIDTTDDEHGKRFKINDAQGNVNRLEAKMIAHTLVEINRQLEQEGYHKDNKMKVGVVSFYQPQCRVIREEIRKVTGKTKGWFPAIDVEINTVIRYQGKEKPIILLSLVKNNGGDLSQKFRAGRANIARFEFINVAMSRAQNLLLVFGARNMLENREVRLPKMDEQGFDKKTVYKSMFKFLEYTSETGGICSVQEFAQTLPNSLGVETPRLIYTSGSLKQGKSS